MDKETSLRLHLAMYEWWTTWPEVKYCEQCNKRLPKQFSTMQVHHLLPKNLKEFKKVMFEEKYWMLLCNNCHKSWEDHLRGDIIKERTQKAKNEYYEL